jgi:hypothetical protein
MTTQKDYKETFRVYPEHLKLLQRMCVEWDDCEFGAPAIDPKRPYGNSSVYQDMLEIFGLEEIKEGIFKFRLFMKEYLLKGEDKFNIDLENEEELNDVLLKLHKETETVLQIVLHAGQFKAGKYGKTDDYKWEYIDPLPPPLQDKKVD